ncbi:MAG: Eco57I restriction-modification methylase domain-containing protein, partial [Candidatus Binatia bacterium]
EPESKAEFISQEVVDELFNIKVLDPAMGSGHFLVEAVDYITDKTLDFLNAFPWNPVIAHLSRMRNTILQQMDEQGITIDPRRLTDVNLLKRHILKRCIYGVDVNPMAVELAKVSLWLDCFTLGAPLSFLDHHLRCGNSLIGVTVEDVDKLRAAKGQLLLSASSDWQGLLQAIQGMIEVGGLPDVTSAQVARSRSTYKSALSNLENFKKILDVHTARWFIPLQNGKGKGKKAKPKEDPFDYILRSGDLFEWSHGEKAPLLDVEPYHSLLSDCANASKEKRFFHWELEFPEVFYGPRPGTIQAIERLQSAGFDAVIGNPPYIAVDSLSGEERRYFPSRYLFLHRKYDVMAVFLSKVLTHCRPNGLLGMIVPQIWQSGVNYDRLRKELLCIGSRVVRLVNLPFNTFQDAYIDNSVLVLKRCSEGNENYVFLYKGYDKHDSADDLLVTQHTTVPVISKHIAAGNPVAAGGLSQLSQRLANDESRYLRLGAIVDCCQGPVESFLSLGSELKRDERFPQVYAVPEVDRYVCRTISRRRLKGFSEENYSKFYAKPRILARRILSRQDRLLFGTAIEPFVCKKDFNPIVPKDSRYCLSFLLAVLNSRLTSRLYIASSAISMKDDFRQT